MKTHKHPSIKHFYLNNFEEDLNFSTYPKNFEEVSMELERVGEDAKSQHLLEGGDRHRTATTTAKNGHPRDNFFPALPTTFLRSA